jgi:TolA-binding protein
VKRLGGAWLVVLLASVPAAADKTAPTAPAKAAPASASAPAPTAASADPLDAYFAQLEAMKLIDTTSGTIDTLRSELGAAEILLRDGAFANAAVALYAIVKSPRYSALTEFVEYQNAEYDLGVALARAGSYGAALDALDVVLARGPAAPYWGPAHRRVVDIALETRDYTGILARLEARRSGAQAGDPIPPSASSERAYLRGRAAYEQGNLGDAEGELVTISKKSRLYSSALYLRGVIRARRGELKASADALCEVAGTPDSDKVTFVVDDRYFTIKDLARLGLGRLAHEAGEYDDAYYHYFQIPDDSQYLPDALFEAAWSMYQKRELPTARDLVKEFLAEFPTSPLWPEANLLAGYIELADCKFDDSKKSYDTLIARLQPVADELDRIRKDAHLRDELFEVAMSRYREIRATGKLNDKAVGTQAAASPRDEVVALLRLDPRFVRISEAVVGAKQLAASSANVIATWEGLGRRISDVKVGAVSTDSAAQQAKEDAVAQLEDFRRLADSILDQQAQIARAKRDGTIAAADADAELTRLDALHQRAAAAVTKAQAAADAAAAQAEEAAVPTLRPLLAADLAAAQRLARSASELAARLATAGGGLSQTSVDDLFLSVRKVLDKAKLGKVDAVIGQKRKLDIQVSDLAQGRFPEELIGRLWNASMIGDDEEFWPWQGEYWADEYEGFR